MTSFTSNSKPFPFGRLLFACVLCFAGYLGFLQLPTFRYGGGNGSSDLQNCLIRAERYTADLRNPEFVLVGTSKTGRLRADLMGEHFFNLSYPCLGVAGGVYYIKKKTEKPKVVLLEASLFMDYTDLLVAGSEEKLESWPITIRSQFKFLRQEYYVFSVLKHILRYKFAVPPPESEWFLPTRIDLATGKPYIDQKAAASLSATATSLEPGIQKQAAEGLPPLALEYVNWFVALTWRNIAGGQLCENHWEGKFEVYAQIVNDLIKNGSQVVLHEVPEPLAIQNLKCQALFRTKLKETFPNLLYIDSPNHPYKTTDGIHLSPEESIHYSAKLKAILTERFPQLLSR